MADLEGPVGVQRDHRWLPIALLLSASLLAGCVATESTTRELSVSDGSGPFLIYLVVQDGELTRSEAWWADQAPDLEVGIEEPVPGWEAIILKNDAAIQRVTLMGDAEKAFLLWNSEEAGTVASPGDSFEVLVVDETAGETRASFALSIEP